ncbi:MAG TPA: hypothetical protein VFR85_02830 [Anaeromyxobacteraceae bacterium]|nr:hypothetical protein [Anaeromyxobacteraceae bacterium]
MRALACAAAVVCAIAPLRAAAHEILHQVQRGRALAVRAFFQDGQALADQQAEVYSPADPKIPYWRGRTDRNGWLAFVPDVPGKWRVRVVDATGHGLDTQVDVEPAIGGPDSGAPSGAGPLGLALRPVVGAAVIAAIFGGLYLWRRRRSA